MIQPQPPTRNQPAEGSPMAQSPQIITGVFKPMGSGVFSRFVLGGGLFYECSQGRSLKAVTETFWALCCVEEGEG